MSVRVVAWAASSTGRLFWASSLGFAVEANISLSLSLWGLTAPPGDAHVGLDDLHRAFTCITYEHIPTWAGVSGDLFIPTWGTHAGPACPHLGPHREAPGRPQGGGSLGLPCDPHQKVAKVMGLCSVAGANLLKFGLRPDQIC